MGRILVVDDKEMMRDSLEATLVGFGHEVSACASAHEALARIEQETFDLVVSDLKMPKMDGLAFLDQLSKMGSDTPVIMMTAYATISTAVEAMRKGAYDYIQKPFDASEISIIVDRALEHRRLLQENEAYRAGSDDVQRGRSLIGEGPAMTMINEKVDLVAASSATVLIRGESGTGKELVARALHSRSGRAAKPLLCVNCAALSSSLLESELFGHEKGAFTGADRMRKGRFELADGGTLLLDEISEMGLGLQSKLLRVLQEREFERVGSSVTRQVDVRVIATTNRNLETWVRESKFREDLFYRLNVVPIELPGLRERGPEDIMSLWHYFAERSAEREGRGVARLSDEAMEMLTCYDWPGNVRELENLVDRISILAREQIVTGAELQIWLGVGHGQLSEMKVTTKGPLPLAEVERQVIERTLAQFDGHRQKTAQALGIGVRTLGMKLKKWRTERSELATV